MGVFIIQLKLTLITFFGKIRILHKKIRKSLKVSPEEQIIAGMVKVLRPYTKILI